MTKKSTLAIVFISITLLACNSMPSEKKAAGSKNADRQLSLSFKPADNCTYLYNIVNKTTTTVETPAGETETVNNSTSNVQYDLVNDSAGGYQVKITYKKIHVYLKKNGIETEMTAPNSNPVSDPAEKLLSSLINTPD